MGRTWIKRGAFAVVALLALGFAIGSLGGTAPLGSADLSTTSEALARDGSAWQGFSGVTGAPASQEDAIREGAKATDAAPPSTLPLGDRIIRTGELAVEVEEGTFDDAWREALQVAR